MKETDNKKQYLVPEICVYALRLGAGVLANSLPKKVKMASDSVTMSGYDDDPGFQTTFGSDGFDANF